MRALVTRPEEDVAPLAAALRGRGIEPVIEPLLAIAPEPASPLTLDGVQALLFTSANGVRAFAEREKRRDLPVFAVGDATARVARALGFEPVTSAGGDGAALAALVARELDPAQGALLHARGRDTTEGLAASLEAAGFELRPAIVYRAEPAQAFSPELRAMLEAGAIDLALFFSPRTAQTFVKLLKDAGLEQAAGKIAALCLSRAVAAALAALPFRAVAIAGSPTQGALLAVLDEQGAVNPPAGQVARPSRRAAQPDRDEPVAAEAEPDARTRRGGSRLAIAAVASVVVIAAAAGAYVYSEGRRAAPEPATVVSVTPPDRIGPLEGEVARLRQEIAALRQGLATRGGGDAEALRERIEALERVNVNVSRALSGAAQSIATLDARLARIAESAGSAVGAAARTDELASRVAALEARSGDGEPVRGEVARIEAALKSLEGKVAALEARAGAEGAQERAAALVVALGQLREAVDSGRTFAASLDAVAALGAGDARIAEAVAALRPAAERGLPNLRELSDAFGSVARDLARAALAPEGAGWAERTLQRLSKLVTVRRVGADVAGDTPDAVAARAEARLAGGDLAGAATELDRLSGPAAAPAQQWLAAAKARLAAERTLDEMSRHALARFAAGREGAPAR
jgi:uroporphyrinogen-III synthase